MYYDLLYSQSSYAVKIWGTESTRHYTFRIKEKKFRIIIIEMKIKTILPAALEKNPENKIYLLKNGYQNYTFSLF